ncbi:MAG: YicC family protein [Geobacter sp.]|nr:YicC family protein [Geobacter sp.]
MIRSMTGFGKAEADSPAGRIIVEIKSVNHRYCETFVKLPRVLTLIESDVKKRVAERLKRGKIEVYIQLEPGEHALVPAVNIGLARGYCEAFRFLKEELELADEVSLSLILDQKDVLAAPDSRTDSDEFRRVLLDTVGAAAERLENMRLEEGKSLCDDLLSRRSRLAELLDSVAERVPVVVSEYAVKLRERLAKLLEATPLDESRLAQEVAIMADRGDVTEELVRFRSHLAQLDAFLAEIEPVGRKLDFLLQEMNREVNTIGSKANDAQIAMLVVELKAELEKIREQVQNIE